MCFCPAISPLSIGPISRLVFIGTVYFVRLIEWVVHTKFSWYVTGTLLESSQNNESGILRRTRIHDFRRRSFNGLWLRILRPPNWCTINLNFYMGQALDKTKKKKFKPNYRTLHVLDNGLIDFSFLDFSKKANNVGLVSGIIFLYNLFLLAKLFLLN